MSFQKKLAAGVQNAWLSFLDFENFALGNDPAAIAAGLIRGSYQFTGIQQMPSGVLEGEPVPIPGDDTTLGSILFDSDAPFEFLMNFGQGDQTLEAKLQGTLVEAMGTISMGLVAPEHPVYPTVTLLVQSRTIKRDTGNSGQSAWSGFLYPVVQIQPLNRETFQGRTAASFRYKGVAQRANYKPWGVTISDAANGDTGAYAFDMNSNNPLTLDAFTLNGVLTSWILNKTPVAVNSTFPFSERVAMTVNSVTPSTRTMVVSSAGVSGQRAVVVYEYT